MPANDPEQIEVLGREFLKQWFLPRLPVAQSHFDGDPPSVCVIGAGIAGLCAGYELSRLGYHTTVLEASQRIGGRIYTYRFSNGQYGELGAMRVPEVHSAVKHYVELFGLETRPFQSRPVTCQTGLDSHGLYSSILADAWKEVCPANLLALRNNRLEPPFADYEQHTLKQYLSSRISSDAYERVLAGEHMKAYEDSSFLETVLGFLNYKDRAMYEIAGGFSCLADAFADSIQSRPHCAVVSGIRVDAITIRDDGVSVGGLKGNLFEKRFDFVLCAIAPSALASIQFTPQLPGYSLHTVASHYIAASKTIGLISTPFWKPAIQGGVAYTDSDAESLWYPNSDLRVLTLQYSRGDAAIRFSELASSKKEAVLMDTLRKLHPGARFELQDLIHQCWQSPATGTGGFCRLKPGQFLRQCTLSPWKPMPAERARLFFAGEAYSLTHGWIQGAIESGLQAVDDIARSRAV